MRQCGLHDMEGTVQVHAENCGELVPRHLLQWAWAIDAGIVDQNVDAAEVQDCRFDDRSTAFRGGDRCRRGDGLAPRLTNLIDDVLRRTGIR